MREGEANGRLPKYLTAVGQPKSQRERDRGSSIKLKLTRQSVNELFGGHVAMCPGNEEGNAALGRAGEQAKLNRRRQRGSGLPLSGPFS